MKTFSGNFYSWGCTPLQQTVLARFYYDTGKAFYQIVLPRMPVAYQALAIIQSPGLFYLVSYKERNSQVFYPSASGDCTSISIPMFSPSSFQVALVYAY